MNAQAVVVALLVAGCCLYAVWTLMPSAARRGLASVLLRWPLPAPARRWLGRFTGAASGCGCDGCDRSEPTAKLPGEQPVRFHPRRPG